MYRQADCLRRDILVRASLLVCLSGDLGPDVVKVVESVALSVEEFTVLSIVTTVLDEGRGLRISRSWFSTRGKPPQLQDEWASGHDTGSSGQEVPPYYRLQHRGFTRRLSANDDNLWQLNRISRVDCIECVL